ncbi:IS6 family transposase [Alphaproteobacteria bacterium]|nr:IS6 family transposase [Alphaproteobacteria bacterium]
MRSHYKCHRVPKDIIGFAVKYYFRYKLSLRDVSDLLLDRGIQVSYESIRKWIHKWGPLYAHYIRKKRGFSFQDKWHIDEMRVKIKGEVFWLWRLVDSYGEEIEILLQKRRNAKAAIRFLKKALRRLGKPPRVMVTDKLRSYGKAHRTIMKSSEHRAHKGLNNRAENSHQPTREKERQMRGFKVVGSTQRLLASMGAFMNLLKVGRYKNSAQEYRLKLKKANSIFQEVLHSQDICA